MAYVAINEHRIPYDIDGSEVGFKSGDYSGLTLSQLLNQYPTWLTTLQKSLLNSEGKTLNLGTNYRWAFFFFLQELTEVAAFSLLHAEPMFMSPGRVASMLVYGSDDSTNGLDGTWETAVFIKPDYSERPDWWRANVVSLSFSKPVKVVKIGFDSGSTGSGAYTVTPKAIHLFGRKAAGQNPNDIVFTDASGDILTSLVDFGDVPEGTTSYQQIRVKNASATKNANNINLQLNHADFDFSYSPTGPWVSVIDISSLGPGSLSQVIYLRNHLEPPLLPLGPKAARIIASVGSWT